MTDRNERQPGSAEKPPRKSAHCGKQRSRRLFARNHQALGVPAKFIYADARTASQVTT